MTSSRQNVGDMTRALAQVRVLCDVSPDAVVAVDASGVIHLLNVHAENMFGYAPGELLGQPIERLLPEALRDRHRRHRDGYAATPRQRPMGASMDLYGQRRDGTQFPVEISLSPVESDGVTLFCSAIRDISDRRIVAERLREIESRFRTLVDYASDGIFISDANGRYQDVNPSGCAMFGYTRDEILARSIADLVAPEELPRLAGEMRRLGDGSAVRSEWRFRRKDGALFVGEVNSRRLPDTRIQASLRDITERKEAEEKLRQSQLQLLASQRIAHIGSWEIELQFADDLHRNPIRLSDEGRRIFGLDPGVRPITLDVLMARVHPDDRGEFEDALRRAISTRSACSLDHRIVVDGAERFLHEQTELVVDPTSGAPVTLIGTTQDITDRVKLEAQVRESQKMQAIGRLAGGVAHDFNNLLTVINGFAEMLLTDPKRLERERRELTAIRDAGERAAQLTRQLLLFSRKAVLEPRVLPLNDLVERVVVMLRRLIGEDIELRMTLAPLLPSIKADPGQMEQLLLNLALNARDAMRHGGRLTIETQGASFDAAFCRAHPDHREGSFVELRVTDNGTGMTEEVRTHLFEPFFTTKGAGRGLGLATVYGIVQESRGFIAVSSEVDVGTTVRVYLPAVDPLAQGEASRMSPESRKGHETILLVEDEEAVRGVVTLALTMHGYRVLSAASGAAALRLLDAVTEPIDLLVTDVVMPEMNGVQLAHALRKRCPTCRVLFVSGYNEDVALRHLAPNDAFLQKPFTPRVLAQKVREILDQPR